MPDYKSVPQKGSITTKTFASPSGSFGSQKGGSEEFFCFNGCGLQVELPMSSLNITAGELDQILYIHRGRYNQTAAGQTVIIPLKRNGKIY